MARSASCARSVDVFVQKWTGLYAAALRSASAFSNRSVEFNDVISHGAFRVGRFAAIHGYAYGVFFFVAASASSGLIAAASFMPEV
jgi:hypothetical protein